MSWIHDLGCRFEGSGLAGLSSRPVRALGHEAQSAIRETTWCKVTIPGTKSQPPVLKGASVSPPQVAGPILRFREKKEQTKKCRDFYLKAKSGIWP